MRDKLNNSWGQFSGAIYTDFRLTQPLVISTSTTDDRRQAKPIVSYRIQQPKRWHFLWHGCTEFGEMHCQLNPVTKHLFGFPQLQGDLLLGKSSVGIIKIAEADNYSRLIECKLIEDGSRLILERNYALGGENDMTISHASIGPIISLPRFDYNWSEMCGSKMGFGRLKRGSFVNSFESHPASNGIKGGILVLLCIYFQIVKDFLNADSGGS